MSRLRGALRDLPDAVFGDLLESEDAYMLVFDLGGATAETTELTVESGRLVVEARRQKHRPGGFEYVREERPLFVDVEVPLPPDATGAGASASMDRGVLEVHLPKRTGAPAHEISVTETEGDVDAGA